MEMARIVRLFEDGGHYELGGVGEQAPRARGVPHAQHRRRRERSLERIEAQLLGVAPTQNLYIVGPAGWRNPLRRESKGWGRAQAHGTEERLGLGK